jgi:ABC-2 type transport system permease protein
MARGVMRAAAVEGRKLALQAQSWIVLAVCAASPFAFVGAMRAQSSVPSDTLFGRLVHESGFATPLVILGFAGLWGLPVLAGVAGGDMFASEDRHRTWAAVLTRSRSRAEIFAAKVAVAFGFATLALLLLAVSSAAAGVLLVGTQPLVDLSGLELSASEAFGRVAVAWLSVVPAYFAITAVAVLLSIATRSSVAGVGVPVVAAFALQLVALADMPEVLRRLVPTTAFEAWHGLLTQPAFYGPVVYGVFVNTVCAVAAIAIALGIFLQRDVT